MLGDKSGIFLVITVASFSLISSAFADSIFIEFDKSEYETGDTLTISGFVVDFSMPIVAMSVYDPTGKILSANNVELDSEGNFSKIVFLDAPFYEVPGEYKVKIDYRNETLEEFFTILGEVPDSELILEKIEPEIIILTTEKSVYSDGENIVITGIVSTLESPTVLIGIYDPFGTPAGFYFGTVDKNLEFSTNFLAKSGVNFKIDGTYSVKAHYGENEATTSFEFYEELKETKDDTAKEDNTKNDNTKNDNKDDNIKNDNTKNDNTKNETKDDNTKNDNLKNDNTKNDNTKNDKTENDNQSTINSPEDNSIIQEDKTKKQNNDKQPNDPIIKDNSNKEKKSSTTPTINNPPKKSDNLSVEDIELGKLLNQINLECDRSKYSDTISYYDGMGPSLYRLCKFESSIQFFNESLQKNPNNPEILTNKGSALGKLGYNNEALHHFDKALSINPNFLPAINNKANIHAKLGNFDEAISLYTSALGKNPNYSAVRENLALVLSEMPPQNPPIHKTDIDTQEKSVNQETSSPIQLKPQNEKPSDFFEQVGSMFSTVASLLGLSD